MKRLLYKIVGLAFYAAAVWSTQATVSLTFSWDKTYYQSGYSAEYVTSADAVGIYRFNTSGDSSVPRTIWTVCLDPQGVVDGATHTYDIIPFAQANPGIHPAEWASGNGQYWGVNNAAYLWNKYGMDIVNNTGNVGNQNQRAAALEFAIWNALYNSTGYGVLGEDNWAAPTTQMQNKGALGYFNEYTTDLINNAPHQASYTGNILRGTSYNTYGQGQEFFMLESPAYSPAPVPEPTTIVAGALLLLPFGTSAIRMFRKKSKS